MRRRCFPRLLLLPQLFFGLLFLFGILLGLGWSFGLSPLWGETNYFPGKLRSGSFFSSLGEIPLGSGEGVYWNREKLPEIREEGAFREAFYSGISASFSKKSVLD